MSVLPQLERELLAAHGRLGQRRRFGGAALPALRLSHLAPVAAVLVVVAVVAVFVSVHGRGPAGSAGKAGVQLVFQAEPTPQTLVTRASLAGAIAVMRGRAEALGVSGGSFRAVGGNQIRVQLPGTTNLARAEREFGTTARLEFYDWEANALIPASSGTTTTVASQLSTQDSTALTVSQGSGSSAPGSPGAGSMPLYTAVQRAAKQPENISKDATREGPQYFAFGSPGSALCTLAARYYHVTPLVGQHCYLAGPQDKASDLDQALPTGISASDKGIQVLVVQQGTVVLQAVPTNFMNEPGWIDPSAQFYVLKDHVSLFGNDITNPQQSTDPSGAPAVSFGFTPQGGTEFQTLTAQIAHRGDLVSGLGQTLEQHFAVALDTQLITVPSIDFKTYPDGLAANNGATIPGGLTRASARELATELRLGALPVRLRLILAKRLSANG